VCSQLPSVTLSVGPSKTVSSPGPQLIMSDMTTPPDAGPCQQGLLADGPSQSGKHPVCGERRALEMVATARVHPAVRWAAGGGEQLLDDERRGPERVGVGSWPSELDRDAGRQVVERLGGDDGADPRDQGRASGRPSRRRRFGPGASRQPGPGACPPRPGRSRPGKPPHRRRTCRLWAHPLPSSARCTA